MLLQSIAFDVSYIPPLRLRPSSVKLNHEPSLPVSRPSSRGACPASKTKTGLSPNPRMQIPNRRSEKK